MRKAAVAWLDVAGRPPYPVWCQWVDDSLYVVSGPDEQLAPGLAHVGGVVRVSARGDHGGRIVTWPARVSRVRPESKEWATAVPQLAAKRLNGPPAGELVERWARTAMVSRLTPVEPPA